MVVEGVAKLQAVSEAILRTRHGYREPLLRSYPSRPHSRCQPTFFAAGEVGVDRRGLQVRVPEPARDDVERDVLFQRGDGEAVP